MRWFFWVFAQYAKKISIKSMWVNELCGEWWQSPKSSVLIEKQLITSDSFLHVKSLNSFVWFVYLCCCWFVYARWDRDHSNPSCCYSFNGQSNITMLWKYPNIELCSYWKLTSVVHSHIAYLELDSRAAQTGSPSLHLLFPHVPFLWIVEIFRISSLCRLLAFRSPEERDDFSQWTHNTTHKNKAITQKCAHWSWGKTKRKFFELTKELFFFCCDTRNSRKNSEMSLV